jgi:1,4-alpha-glucan branching enzyme
VGNGVLGNPPSRREAMSIKKQYLKTRPECKVKFRLTRDQAGGASEVRLLGDFNGWNRNAEPMNRLKSGDFTTILYLDLDQSYEFRYLTGDGAWLNDTEADGSATTPYPEAANSVIMT